MNDTGSTTSQTQLLIVDDDALTREVIKDLLKARGYLVTEAADGQQALDQLTRQLPDLIILDINMPVMNGFETLKHLQADAALREIPVIIASAITDPASAAQAIELGAVDFLSKPVNPLLFYARINSTLANKRLHDLEQKHIHQIAEHSATLERQVAQQVEEISAGHVATIFAMSKLADYRDPETGEHLERIREYCRVLAAELRRRPPFSELITDEYIETLYAASPLHDIGKVGIPDLILLKPDKLDADEWQVMKTHTTISTITLRAVFEKHPKNQFVRMGIQIAQSHHEKWDGSGYPDGMAGDEIPLCARIMALADVFDALGSRRVYKAAFPPAKTHAIIMEGKGSHFDPRVVAAYEKIRDQFSEIRARFQPLEGLPTDES